MIKLCYAIGVILVSATTVAQSGSTMTTALGRANSGDSPLCVVDGFVHTSILSCITYLSGLHTGNTGEIFSTIPETINGNEFALNNFHGQLILGNVSTTTSDCNASPSPCWQTRGPIMMPTFFKIIGVQNPS